MRVMVVSANSLDPTGEAQFFRHLVAGMWDLSMAVNLEVEAYALNGRGKPLKYDLRPYTEERIQYLPYKKFVETANTFDYVIISTGHFKGDYKWIEGLKVPYGLIVHSLPSIKAHNMEVLWKSDSPPDVTYVLDLSIKQRAIEAGAKESSIFFTHMPFSPRILGPADEMEIDQDAPPFVIVPARIHFVKYPKHVAELLIEAQKKIPDLVGVFFGGDDFFYHTNLKEIVEPCEFLVRQDPYLDEAGKSKWWNWCTLAVDGTRLPVPPMRMQYASMEAAYYGKPILVEEQLHSRLWNRDIGVLPLSTENIITMLSDADARAEAVMNSQAYVNNMHNAAHAAAGILSPYVYSWRQQ